MNALLSKSTRITSRTADGGGSAPPPMRSLRASFCSRISGGAASASRATRTPASHRETTPRSTENVALCRRRSLSRPGMGRPRSLRRSLRAAVRAGPVSASTPATVRTSAASVVSDDRDTIRLDGRPVRASSGQEATNALSRPSGSRPSRRSSSPTSASGQRPRSSRSARTAASDGASGSGAAAHAHTGPARRPDALPEAATTIRADASRKTSQPRANGMRWVSGEPG
mmetsp:Transcript_47998/g.155217  ORF Transcript_47998/g.155217 Transcript_47998/m.155217 type:complete len:228 (-) Transcript_47998:43-726(-)